MWDLVPWSGVKPRPPTLQGQSLGHWTTREVPLVFTSCIFLDHREKYPKYWTNKALICTLSPNTILWAYTVHVGQWGRRLIWCEWSGYFPFQWQVLSASERGLVHLRLFKLTDLKLNAWVQERWSQCSQAPTSTEGPRQGTQPSGELTWGFRPMILGSDPSWENSLSFKCLVSRFVRWWW